MIIFPKMVTFESQLSQHSGQLIWASPRTIELFSYDCLKFHAHRLTNDQVIQIGNYAT